MGNNWRRHGLEASAACVFWKPTRGLSRRIREGGTAGWVCVTFVHRLNKSIIARRYHKPGGTAPVPRLCSVRSAVGYIIPGFNFICIEEAKTHKLLPHRGVNYRGVNYGRSFEFLPALCNNTNARHGTNASPTPQCSALEKPHLQVLNAAATTSMRKLPHARSPPGAFGAPGGAAGVFEAPPPPENNATRSATL